MASKALLVIDKGTNFTYTFNTNTTITGYTCEASLRKHYTSNTSIDFTTSIDDSNTVTISLAANATSNIADGRYVFDVIVTSPANTITRLLEGVALITPNVTT